MSWDSHSEPALVPMRGSRFVGGLSRATVTTPGSADVWPVHEGKRNATSIKSNQDISFLLCKGCRLTIRTIGIHSAARRASESVGSSARCDIIPTRHYTVTRREAVSTTELR